MFSKFLKIAEAGKTVIIVTHNPEVADYADVVIKMKDGEVVETIGKGLTLKNKLKLSLSNLWNGWRNLWLWRQLPLVLSVF